MNLLRFLTLSSALLATGFAAALLSGCGQSTNTADQRAQSPATAQPSTPASARPATPATNRPAAPGQTNLVAGEANPLATYASNNLSALSIAKVAAVDMAARELTQRANEFFLQNPTLRQLAIELNPETGRLGGPLVRAFPSLANLQLPEGLVLPKVLVKDQGFSIQHPQLNNGQPLHYDANGQRVAR